MDLLNNDSGDEYGAEEVDRVQDDLFASDNENENERPDSREGNNEGGEDDNKADNADKDGEADKKKVKAKKVGPPRKLLLHEDMVCGKDGLKKLQEMFKDFKLIGQRGYELQDMNNILHKFEHWVHNLHPKYQFSQTLERLEFLGLKKRSIKTQMKKIRLGLMEQDGTSFVDENNLLEFQPSDHEMDGGDGGRESGTGTAFEEREPFNPDFDMLTADNGNNYDNPITTMSDDDDDAWLLELDTTGLEKQSSNEIALAKQVENEAGAEGEANDRGRSSPSPTMQKNKKKWASTSDDDDDRTDVPESLQTNTSASKRKYSDTISAKDFDSDSSDIELFSKSKKVNQEVDNDKQQSNSEEEGSSDSDSPTKNTPRRKVANNSTSSFKRLNTIDSDSDNEIPTRPAAAEVEVDSDSDNELISEIKRRKEEGNTTPSVYKRINMTIDSDSDPEVGS